MAFIQMNIMSSSLMRTVQVNVLLPVDKLGLPIAKGRKFKTLYLLHGVLGSQIDWVNNTRLQRYAEEMDLAVVMPAGDNGFYVDRPESQNNYGNFVGSELVEITRAMFPLSDKREDTFLGGLSMGGFGAMRNGLKYSETFGAIISLSGALKVDQLDERRDDGDNWLEGRAFMEANFGDLAKVADSDKNPKWLVEELLAKNKKLPAIFMACGDADRLLGANDEFDAFLTQKGVEHTYYVSQGNHDWDFWDFYIRKAKEGLHSGNIDLL